MRSSHFLLVLTAATLWGTGGLLGHQLGEHSNASTSAVALWRMVIAGLALCAYLTVRRQLALSSLTPAMARRVLVTGALIAVFEVLYFASIALAGVGLATLVTIGSAPVCASVWDAVRHRRRPALRTMAALAIAIAGLVALLGGSIDAGDGALAGGALALLTGAVFAGVTVTNRVAVPGLGAVRLTALAFSAGALMLVPVVLATGWSAPTGVAGWGYALALGVGATAVAYVAYFAGLVTVPAVVATIVILVEPLVAAVLGVLVLGESLGVGGIAGAAALGLAVALLRPQRDARVPHPRPPTMVQDPNH